MFARPVFSQSLKQEKLTVEIFLIQVLAELTYPILSRVYAANRGTRCLDLFLCLMKAVLQ